MARVGADQALVLEEAGDVGELRRDAPVTAEDVPVLLAAGVAGTVFEERTRGAGEPHERFGVDGGLGQQLTAGDGFVGGGRHASNRVGERV